MIIVALMLLLHIVLYVWKASMSLAFSLSQPFDIRMVTMAGMGIMTVMVFFISRFQRTNLSLWPKKFDIITTAVMLLSLMMMISTAVCITKGTHGLWLLIYGSIITPLFEELLFRGHIYDIQQRRHHNAFHVITINALLFSVWHLGYIVHPLWCGEWMALSKLVVGLLYGWVLASIRYRTKSTLCCILAHGAFNSFFG